VALTTKEEKVISSLVMTAAGDTVRNLTAEQATPATVNRTVRAREYLTQREIDKLMDAARSGSRYGHRDSTMILIAYRHGLRASELCDLQWSQVDFNAGTLRVRRRKQGSPGTHPLQADEIRALRRLQRGTFVFLTERDGPMTPKAFHALFARIGQRAELPFPVHPQMLRHTCGYMLALTRATIPGLCRLISGTRTSSTRFALMFGTHRSELSLMFSPALPGLDPS
jgi:integrase